jgi:CheY-like chemotaxis protein
MPSMSGLEVLKVLKERNEQTPVVILTTSTDETLLHNIHADIIPHYFGIKRVFFKTYPIIFDQQLALWFSGK